MLSSVALTSASGRSRAPAALEPAWHEPVEVVLYQPKSWRFSQRTKLEFLECCDIWRLCELLLVEVRWSRDYVSLKTFREDRSVWTISRYQRARAASETANQSTNSVRSDEGAWSNMTHRAPPTFTNWLIDQKLNCWVHERGSLGSCARAQQPAQENWRQIFHDRSWLENRSFWRRICAGTRCDIHFTHTHTHTQRTEPKLLKKI